MKLLLSLLFFKFGLLFAQTVTPPSGGGGTVIGTGIANDYALWLSTTALGTGNLSKNSDGSDQEAATIAWNTPSTPTFNASGTTTCNLAASNVCLITFVGTNAVTTLAITNPHGPFKLITIASAGGGNSYTAFPGTLIGAAQPDLGGATTSIQDFTFDGTNLNALGCPTCTWHGITIPEAAGTPTAASGLDYLYASSSTHRTLMSLNGGSALTVTGVASAGTSGHCVQFAASGYDFSDAGSACGAGAGTVTSVGFTGGLISVGTPTTTPAFTVAGTSGGIPYFASASTWASSGALTVNVLTKGGGAGAAPSNSSITDNGTTVSTAEPIATTSTVSTGASPPACTGGTGGGVCWTEGTAFTNVSGAAGVYADSTAHEFLAKTNGASGAGMIQRAQPGAIRSTGLVASVSTATLCAASAGACNTAGTYHVHLAMYQSGTACSVNTTNGVLFSLTWTDGNGTAHSAQTLPIETNGSLTGFATSGIMAWGTSLNAWGSGDLIIDTNGSIIQYATTYQNCTTGTATYALSAVVTRLQ